MRFWYLICFTFLIYCINLLIIESFYGIFYIKFKNGDLMKTHKFSTCLSFVDLIRKDFYLNQSKIEIQKLFNELINQTFILLNKNLLNNLQNNLNFNNSELSYLKFKNDLKEIIKNKDYYINNYYFCLIHQGKMFYFLSNSPFKLRKSKKHFIFRNNPYLFSMNSIFAKNFFLITIFDHESPFSNCIIYNKNNPNQKYSRFLSLNNCLKNRYKSAKYFYTSNETGIIDLEKSNELITNDENNNCFNNKKFNQYDCETNFLIKRSSNEHEIDLFMWKVIESEFIIDKFNLIYNVMGLICLLCKISTYELMIKLLNFFKLKFRLIRSKLKKLNLVILFLNLILILIICIRIILDFNVKILSPKIIENTEFEIYNYEQFFLIACATVQKIIEYKEENNSPNDPFDLFDNDIANKNFTLKELIEKTNTNLSDIIEGIYLDFNGEVELINFKLINSKILFNFINSDQYRCFQIKINLIQNRYQKLLSISKIKVKFYIENYLTYFTIIPERSSLSNRFFRIQNGCSIRIQKIIKQSIKSKCLDYSKSSLGCKDRWNCVDRCIFNGYKTKYSAINSFFLIDNDFINNKSDLNKSVFKIFDDNLIVKKCEEKFYNINCIDQYFKCQNRIGKLFKDELIIDLIFEKVIEEEIVYSFYKLLIDLANIGSIFVGFGFHKLIFMIINLIKIKFKKQNFNYFLLINGYLFCILGFLIHFYFIINKNFNGQLVYSQYFISLTTFKQPEIFFCFDFTNKSININYAQTGNHLFQNLSPDLVFKSIQYRERKKLKLNLILGSNLINNSNFKFNNYILFNKRCLSVQLNQIFKEYDFFYLDDFRTLIINLNLTFIKNFKNFIYFSGIENTKQFSKFIEIKSTFLNSYKLKLKFHEIIYNDRFNIIRNPLLIFKSNYINDVTNYLDKLIKQFQSKYNYSTKKIILSNENFNLIINDQLFNQFYLQTQMTTDQNKFSNLNHNRIFLTNEIEELSLKNDFLLIFFSIFYKNILIITNENNYPTLILDLLNLLSFWFSLDLLDLHIYLFKIKYLIKKFYLFLHKIKNKIKRKI